VIKKPQELGGHGPLWAAAPQEKKMPIACCVIKATNTHSEYVIPIAFPRQQWLHERASVLRYTQVHCMSA